MTPESKVNVLQHMKSELDSRRRKLADPAEWLDRLPTNPLVMQRDFPGSFTSAFGAKVRCSMKLVNMQAGQLRGGTSVGPTEHSMHPC